MLIFGTREREEPRGVVAERCTECDVITRMVVTLHYEVSHVYWVSVGEGTPRQTSLRCTGCRNHFFFKRSRFAEILPIEYAQELAMDELIVRTNPALATEIGLLSRPAPTVPGGNARDATAPCRCESCGHERQRPFRFCPRCGTKHP